MRAQEKGPWLVIVAAAVAAYAIMTAAQWAYPVKASPTPELNERWKRWAEEIRQHEKDAPTTTDARPGTGLPVVPSPSEPR